MPSRKTPTSSLSAIELLIKRFWYRSKDATRRVLSGGGTCTTPPSPVMKLPQDIVDMIIACLIYDLPSLGSCSLTCYTWYIAAVPHLHRTLTVFINSRFPDSRWPNPILRVHTLGLLSFAKTIRIRSNTDDFSSKRLNRCILRKFLVLTNVQRLEIDNLNVSSFIPRIREYFGPFLPTVRSLYLKEPKGSNREILFFIGLFQHLDNLSLCSCESTREPEEDLTLIPSFSPPLQGRLVVWDWKKASLFRDMVRLFGGIRFKAMNLLNVVETGFLLRACAKTLQVLQLHPSDPFACDFLLDFDLSLNRSLRALEMPVESLDDAIGAHTASRLYMHVLSTITSPAFFQVCVIYQGHDFRAMKNPWDTSLRQLSQEEKAAEALQHLRRFQVLRGLHRTRDFQLVLHADVWDRHAEYIVRMLKESVAAEKAEGRFYDLFPEPSVTFFPRSFLHTVVSRWSIKGL